MQWEKRADGEAYGVGGKTFSFFGEMKSELIKVMEVDQ